MSDWLEGKVVENIHWTNNLFSLKVDADVDDFIAGQFTSLALDMDGERVARPYSYLSSPGQRPLEFFFYVATGGTLSGALSGLKPGDSVWVKRRGSGFFTLKEVPPSRDIWMIGTGTGIAPYFSMLNTDEPWQTYENIVLLHGVRTGADLCYGDLVESFGERHPGQLVYRTFVSREDVPGSMRGRIPPGLKDGSIEKEVHLALSTEHSQIMLCGNPEMVKDASEVLKVRGFRKNLRRTPGHITTEKYW